jgi:hypothetical protein
LILCCTKSVGPKSPLDFEKKTFWCFVNNFYDVIRVLYTFFMFI